MRVGPLGKRLPSRDFPPVQSPVPQRLPPAEIKPFPLRHDRNGGKHPFVSSPGFRPVPDRPCSLGDIQMAYDRFDTRDAPREQHSRWQGGRDSDRNWRDDGRRPDEHGERGFFERAGDEVASWFGDEDAERRRREDEMRDERQHRSSGRFSNHDRSRDREEDRDRGRRNWFETRGSNERGGFDERDYNPSWRSELSGPGNRERNWDRDRQFDRNYRPMTGDYGRSQQPSGAGAYGRSERDFDPSQSPWGRDEYRRTSRAGTSDWSDKSRHEDPRYHA